MTEFKTILVEKREGVATITFNRPQVKNAMNPQMHLDMVEALTELEEDEDLRVLVLTGAGDSFCAGQDLKEFFLDVENDAKALRNAREASFRWRAAKLRLFRRPTIAAINGWCFGGAFTTVAACDIAIAAEDAIFGLSEVNFGQIPGGLVTKHVTELLHPRDALFYVFTGRKFDGKQAAAMKFVNYAVPRSQLMDEVYNLAGELKSKHPEVLRVAKETYKYGKGFDYEEAYAWTRAKEAELEHVAGKTWKKGVAQFKAREIRPGLEGYRWDKGDD